MAEEIQFMNMMLMAGSSLFGAGVGVGLLRGSVKQLQKDFKGLAENNTTEHTQIKERQARLRGETNGGEPLYMARLQCMQNRSSCMTSTERLLEEHSKDIKGLKNFARWFMQEKKIPITEINEILGEK